MNVKINNLTDELISKFNGSFEAVSVSFSPDGRYAVVEACRDTLFIAVNVISLEDGELTGDYVDHCWTSAPDEPMLYSIRADWFFIGAGFCKMTVFAPEMVNEFGGRFEKTIKRFYFDWELYKRCYEKTNGVPCTKPDPNERED